MNKDGTTLTGVTIKNVRLQNWNCGIYFKGVASSTASGVTAVSNGKAGINLRTTRGTTISGCTVSGNQQGILLWQDCDGNTISGNTMKDNSDMGLWLAGTGRTSSGIVYDSTGNTVSNNVATGNRYGLYLDFTRGNTVTGNRAANNDDHGIFLDYSSGNRVTGNTVTDHPQSGIVLFDSDGCTISGNTASGNGDYGLWAIDSSGLSISNNQFSGNTDGTHRLSGALLADLGLVRADLGRGHAGSGRVRPRHELPERIYAVGDRRHGHDPGVVRLRGHDRDADNGPEGCSGQVHRDADRRQDDQRGLVVLRRDVPHEHMELAGDHPTFYYPATGTFSPLVKVTYTDGTTAEVKKSVTIT